jgi:hypothetical protein
MESCQCGNESVEERLYIEGSANASNEGMLSAKCNFMEMNRLKSQIIELCNSPSHHPINSMAKYKRSISEQYSTSDNNDAILVSYGGIYENGLIRMSSDFKYILPTIKIHNRELFKKVFSPKSSNSKLIRRFHPKILIEENAVAKLEKNEKNADWNGRCAANILKSNIQSPKLYTRNIKLTPMANKYQIIIQNN